MHVRMPTGSAAHTQFCGWHCAVQALLGQVSALRSEVAEVEGCVALLEEAQFAVELLEASQVRAGSVPCIHVCANIYVPARLPACMPPCMPV